LGQSPAPSDAPHGHARNQSGFSLLWPGSRTRDPRSSSESVRESLGSSTGPSRSFEVTNRPTRTRNLSGDYRQRIPRSFGEMSWLDQRRHMNSARDLDYALSQVNRGPGTVTPSTAEALSTNALMENSHIQNTHPKFPPLFEGLLHVVFNVSLIGLCVITLDELWKRAPVAAFAVFLVWTILFYLFVVILAWNGYPKESILAAAIFRLWSEPHHISTTSRPVSHADLDSPLPSDGRGPYVHHQPAFRTAVSSGLEDEFVHRHPETEDEYDAEDEDIQQRRIEEEMSRRDVSIVTVPRRKLWITNPSNADA